MSRKKNVHLICNAHLDPVWLWEWEEGAAEAVSTFRTAADLCEEFDGFVFNHNEAIIYQWVEEYEPELFARIQRLVRARKWHIMGGWYLQPDCNMPNGESFVRQALYGRRYFRDKFGVTPTTAINFDPFGHSRGLPQILAKSGYDSYIFQRPGQADRPLPGECFVWVGDDGSEVIGRRIPGGYNSPLGKSRGKVESVLEAFPQDDPGLVLWGVGDHGGGPSRKDLRELAKLFAERQDLALRHSTTEAYFAEVAKQRPHLPRYQGDLNPWAVGCYTSQVRIKQGHRRLENELYALEKMASAAWLAGLMQYPQAELDAALQDLLTSEFHDSLPGSSHQEVEEMVLRILGHGQETVSRAKARAFFALAAGQPKAKEGQIPILVYNPHPYPLHTLVECEFMLMDQNWQNGSTLPVVFQGSKPVPGQIEKELSNICLDWRKRVVFEAELKPSQMNRFDCKLLVVGERPPLPTLEGAQAKFGNDDYEVVINTQTGLLDSYKIGGQELLKPGAAKALVIQDNEDPWGMTVHGFRNVIGEFKLLSPKEAARFAGVKAKTLAPVRIIEDGEVRTVIEAVFGWGNSFICQHYKLPKHGMEVEIETRVQWAEKDKMVKLEFPVSGKQSRYVGQSAYSAGELPTNGDEAVAQKWVAVLDDKSGQALTCVNSGTYGSDFSEDGLRLTLLRSAAYSGHPIGDRPIVPQDRFTARIDQGERLFRFWLKGGPSTERLAAIDREALAHNEYPMGLSFFPSGAGQQPKPLVTLSDDVVQLTVAKQAENGKHLIVRLFEPTGEERSTTLSFPLLGFKHRVKLGAWEIKTLRVDVKKKTVVETNLMEKPL